MVRQPGRAHVCPQAGRDLEPEDHSIAIRLDAPHGDDGEPEVPAGGSKASMALGCGIDYYECGYDSRMPNPFPSLKASAMLAVLQREFGYVVVRQKGSHRRLETEGRPALTFAFHDGESLSPGEVRDILVKQAGLTLDEALMVVK